MSDDASHVHTGGKDARMTVKAVVAAVFVSIGLGSFIVWLDVIRPMRLVTQIHPPYQTLSGNRVGGSLTEIVLCAATKVGHPFTLEWGPWAEMQDRVYNSKADAFFGAFRTTWRDSFATASNPILPARIVKIVANHLPHYPPIIGVKMGAGVSSQAITSGAVAIRHEFMDNYEIVDALLDDTIDFAFLDIVILNEILMEKRLPLDTFKTSYIYDESYSVYFSNKFLETHPGFLSSFNKSLIECNPASQERVK